MLALRWWGQIAVVGLALLTVMVAGCGVSGQEREVTQPPSVEEKPWDPEPRSRAIQHILAAGLALQRERPDWALEHYIEAMQLTTDIEVVERAVALAMQLRDDDRLAEAAKRLKELAPERADANQLIGLAALRRGDEDEGVEYLGEFIVQWRGSAGDAFVMLERTLRQGVEDEELMVRVLQRLVDDYPEVEQANIVLAQAAERIGCMEMALEAAAQAYDLGLAGESAWLPRSAILKARLLRQQGSEGRALAVYNQALEVVGEDVDLLYGRGVLRADLGDDDGAEEDLRRVLRQVPDDPQAMNALGYTLADNERNLEEALDFINRALERQPHNAAMLDSKGWVLYRQGRLEESLEYLERAWEEAHDAEIGAHLGELLWELERRDRAREIWRRAAQIDAADRVLNDTLERYGVVGEIL